MTEFSSVEALQELPEVPATGLEYHRDANGHGGSYFYVYNSCYYTCDVTIVVER